MVRSRILFRHLFILLDCILLTLYVASGEMWDPLSPPPSPPSISDREIPFGAREAIRDVYNTVICHVCVSQHL